MARVFRFVVLLCLLGFYSSAALAQKGVSVIQGISSPDFGYLPMYVAKARGFLEQEGLDLKIVVMRGTVSVPALLTGEIQFAVAGSAMNAALKGAPFKAIFFAYNTSTFQFTARPEVRGPEDLKGKIVAVSSPGASQFHATQLMLQKLGLEAGRDVKLLPVGDGQARMIAMETGMVAASANNPDIAAQLVRRGYRILTNSADVYPVPFSGMAVNEELIRKSPDIVRKWLRSHVRAILLIRQHPDDAAQVAEREFKIDSQVSREAVRQSLAVMNPDDPGGFTEKGIRLNIAESARRVGADPERIKIADVVDVSLLREAQRDLGIQCRGGYLCR
jgi:NitT/TauT family transport system substrate-binding protein